MCVAWMLTEIKRIDKPFILDKHSNYYFVIIDN